MTDLPRQIPTNPAEQEEQMPDWVKDYIRRQYPGLLTVSPKASCWPHALDVWRYMPEPVDPDEATAQELMDMDETTINIIPAAIKRGRALERGEG